MPVLCQDIFYVLILGFGLPSILIGFIADWVGVMNALIGFGAGLVAGAAITSEQFTIGRVAVDESDRLIYNSFTGGLFFDADGTGSSQQVKIAQLATGLAMNADNIFVFA